jgi:AcrR family transcriptional regulator
VVNPQDTTVQSTQEKILQAARAVFLEKGMEGSRMQEIADLASINKALLHYYFRNKETLFQAVFNQAIQELLPALTEVFRSNRPLLEKIPAFFEIHIGFIQQNPMIPHFIMSEISRNPEMILQSFKAVSEEGIMGKIARDIKLSVAAGEIRDIEPLQLIMNLLSLSVFPFLARPLFTEIAGIGNEGYDRIMEERKAEVSKFVIHALK